MSKFFEAPPRSSSSRRLNRTRSKNSLRSPLASPLASPKDGRTRNTSTMPANSPRRPQAAPARPDPFANRPLPSGIQSMKGVAADIWSPKSDRKFNLAPTTAETPEDYFAQFSKPSKTPKSSEGKRTNQKKAKKKPMESSKSPRKKEIERAATTSNMFDSDNQKEVLGDDYSKSAANPKSKGLGLFERKGGDEDRDSTLPSYTKSKSSIKTSDSLIVAERIDAIEMMRQGTQFLKYGSYGFPHFRHFHLSENNKFIQWYSKNKHPKKTTVAIADIKELVLGQKMEKFRRHKAPELEKSSFSLIYSSGKTLDLIAIQPREFKIWITGLNVLIKLAREQGEAALQGIQNLYMTVKTTSKLEGEKTVMNAHGDAFPTLNRGSQRGDKAMEKSVSKEVQKLRKRFADCEKKISAPKFMACTRYSSMKLILTDVEKNLKILQGHFEDGAFQDCDDSVWRSQVSLESLEHMMACAGKM